MITVREALTVAVLIVLICAAGWVIAMTVLWALLQVLYFMGSVLVSIPTY